MHFNRIAIKRHRRYRCQRTFASGSLGLVEPICHTELPFYTRERYRTSGFSLTVIDDEISQLATNAMHISLKGKPVRYYHMTDAVKLVTSRADFGEHLKFSAFVHPIF